MNEINPYNSVQDTDHDTLLSMWYPWNLDTKNDSDSRSSSDDDSSSSAHDEADKKDDEIGDHDDVTDDEEQSLNEEQIDQETSDEELAETEHNREESLASDEENEGANENVVNDKEDDGDDEEEGDEGDEGEDGEMYDLGESGYEPPTSSSVLRQELVEKYIRDQMKLFDTDEDENDMMGLRIENNDTRQSLMRSIMSDRSSVSLVGLLWQAVSQRMGGLSSILNSNQLQWLPPFIRSVIERRMSAISSSAVDGQQFNENDLFLKDYLAIERYRRDMGKFKNMRVVGADARLPTTSNILIPSYQAKTTFEVSRRMRKHYD